MRKLLRRGDLAKALGTTIPTVKYYTGLSLFPIRQKTDHGQFLYDLEEIRQRYWRIKELKEKRFTMQEIKDRLKIEAVVQN